jgi:predicted dinucleotide-binding enzyme
MRDQTLEETLKVGILGSGNVGQALGTGFATLGHEVTIGSREPESDKLRAWAARAGQRASTGSFAEAAAQGELIVLATLWSGTESALELAERQHLAGKVVIDVTNPLAFDPGPRLAIGHTDSGGEQVQRWLPESRVVKAFNTIGNPFMFRPEFPGGPPDMFICGNDAAAKGVVGGICQDFGWSVVDVGGIEGARLLEPMCMLWLAIMFRQPHDQSGAHGVAFKLLRK